MNCGKFGPEPESGGASGASQGGRGTNAEVENDDL